MPLPSRSVSQVCDASSVDLADTWDYVMLFPDRTGHNLALHNGHADKHRWWYYPQMTAPDEALIFKVGCVCPFIAGCSLFLVTIWRSTMGTRINTGGGTTFT